MVRGQAFHPLSFLQAPHQCPLETPTHWDESTLGIFAATLISEYTLVIMQHVARLTDAALLARGDRVGAGFLTVDIRIRAGGLTRRQAAGEVAVGWALQSCGGERVGSGERSIGQSKQRLQTQY